MGDVDSKRMSEMEVCAWLAEVFEEPAGALKVETPRHSIVKWDSLGVLTLMAGLDEKFDLVVSDQEMSSMTKIGDVLALLRQRGKLSG